MYQKPRGTEDIYGKKARVYSALRFFIYNIMDNFGYNEIVTPIFENTDLFLNSVGETTDIISKEIFTFNDRKNRSLSLRPEFTAPVMRSIIENKLYADNIPLKLFYIGQCFRYERPQKGRQREFWQFGVELVGVNSYLAEVEVITILTTLLDKLSLNNYKLKLNYLLKDKAKEKYIIELKKFLTSISLCSDCSVRIEKNPLRALDCKIDKDKMDAAPKMFDFLSKEEKDYFNKLTKMLGVLNIESSIDHKLVRGLDYYSGVIFEVDVADNNGDVFTVAGGGRYDGLINRLDGPELESVGFGLGIERIIHLISDHKVDIVKDIKYDVYLIGIDEKTRDYAMLIATILRKDGISCKVNLNDKSLKSSLKQNNLKDVDNIIVIGEEEIKNDKFKLKNLGTKKEISVDFKELLNYLKSGGEND